MRPNSATRLGIIERKHTLLCRFTYVCLAEAAIDLNSAAIATLCAGFPYVSVYIHMSWAEEAEILGTEPSCYRKSHNGS